jgi:hypothetical protein
MDESDGATLVFIFGRFASAFSNIATVREGSRRIAKHREASRMFDDSEVHCIALHIDGRVCWHSAGHDTRSVCGCVLEHRDCSRRIAKHREASRWFANVRWWLSKAGGEFASCTAAPAAWVVVYEANALFQAHARLDSSSAEQRRSSVRAHLASSEQRQRSSWEVTRSVSGVNVADSAHKAQWHFLPRRRRTHSQLPFCLSHCTITLCLVSRFAALVVSCLFARSALGNMAAPKSSLAGLPLSRSPARTSAAASSDKAKQSGKRDRPASLPVTPEQDNSKSRRFHSPLSSLASASSASSQATLLQSLQMEQLSRVALGLGMAHEQVEQHESAEALTDAISQLEIMGGASAISQQQLQQLLEEGERLVQQQRQAEQEQEGEELSEEQQEEEEDAEQEEEEQEGSEQDEQQQEEEEAAPKLADAAKIEALLQKQASERSRLRQQEMAALKQGIGKQPSKGSSRKSVPAAAASTRQRKTAATGADVSSLSPLSALSAAAVSSSRRSEGSFSVPAFSPPRQAGGSPQAQAQRQRYTAAGVSGQGGADRRAAAAEEQQVRSALPIMDVVLRQPRDDFSPAVVQQLLDGTCPSLDARLRTHTLLEHEESQHMLLKPGVGGAVLLKQAPRTRLVSSQGDLLEALLEEIKCIESRALQLDRVCFLELVLDYARKYDTQLAIEYARAVIKYRLAPERLRWLPALCERMLSPADSVTRDVFEAARAAYADRTARRSGSSVYHSAAVAAASAHGKHNHISSSGSSKSAASSKKASGQVKWLSGVCRDYNNGRCKRAKGECSYAHACGVCRAAGVKAGHAGCTGAPAAAAAGAASS